MRRDQLSSAWPSGTWPACASRPGQSEMSALIRIASVLLAAIATRGYRWAYIGFIVLGLLYFPLQVGFQLNPQGCQLAFNGQLALLSFTNYAHIVLFGIFFLISNAHFRARQWPPRRAALAAATATLVMGALVEIAQGVSGNHNCKARDLIPDATGVLLGALLLWSWRYVRRAGLGGAYGTGRSAQGR